MALNLFWSLQLLPGVLGLAFPDWPLLLRTLLLGYSLLAVMPATVVVYALVRRVCQGDEATVEAARDAFRAYTLASMRALAPLLVGMGFGVWAVAAFAGKPEFLVLDALLRAALLTGSVLFVYWGPLLVARPHSTTRTLLKQSCRLLVKHPALTLKSWIVMLLAATVGAVSVGGVFLIVFVLIALLQTQLFLELREA